MAGSKGVQTRSEASKGGNVKTRGGGVKTRGGRSGGGGRSNGGRSSGDVLRSTSVENLVIFASGGSNNRPSTDIRGKGITAESRGKGKAIDIGGSSSHRDDGDGTPPAPKATRRPSSSQSSNPSGQLSPPSQGTPQSAGNVSVSRTIPLQYPASSFRVESPSSLRTPNQNRLQLHNHVDEEEEEADEEEADEEDDEVEAKEDGVDDMEADHGNGEDEDYEQLLADIIADPGRQSLPLLSEEPHPVRDTLW